MNKYPEIYNLQPNEEDINYRLDKYIAKYIDTISRTQIQTLIKDGFIQAGGKIIKSASYKIKDEIYQITVPEPKKNRIEAANIPLNIVYEDEDLLVINKQSGLTTHPGAGNYDNTLVNALINYLGDNLSSIGGTERPGIVHRLDKDTSGLMIVAKNNEAHQHLSEQLKTRDLKRIYHALCWGLPKPVIGRVETYIRRHKTNRLKMEVDKYDGKLAITNYKVIKSYLEKISLVECSLQTGRTHQIRVHMSHLGYPIVGDRLYGNNYKTMTASLPDQCQELSKALERQALIAKKIGFIHPRTEEYMEFEIEYDEDIGNLAHSLNRKL